MTDITEADREKAREIMCKHFFCMDLDVARDIATALAETRQRALEEAANLHESINPASGMERLKGDPGAGAMEAIIEYRDAIRSLASSKEKS